jgi:peptide/nickel transport system permease protein
MSSQILLGESTAQSAEAELERRTSWRHLGRELLRSRKGMIGACVLVVVIVIAVAAPVITPYSPNSQQLDFANAGPRWTHPFGTDELGRDVLTRTFYGARISLVLALLVVASSATIGTLLGALAGYMGGSIEFVIMRTTDFLLVFPWLLLALLLLTILGAGFQSMLIALCALFWLTYARVVRAEALKLRELEFIEAARIIGSTHVRTLLRHILPNVLHTVIVLATLDVSVVIIAEAGLTYLGLGIQPPTPTWGGMIAEGQSYLSQSAWIALAPAGVLMVTVIGINLFGDWLRDAFDPTLRT